MPTDALSASDFIHLQLVYYIIHFLKREPLLATLLDCSLKCQFTLQQPGGACNKRRQEFDSPTHLRKKTKSSPNPNSDRSSDMDIESGIITVSYFSVFSLVRLRSFPQISKRTSWNLALNAESWLFYFHCSSQIQEHLIHIALVTSSSNHHYLQAPLATVHLLPYLRALPPPRLLPHLSLKVRLHQLPPTALQLCRGATHRWPTRRQREQKMK